MTEYIYVSRKQFEDWLEVLDADLYQSPSYNHSRLRASGVLPETDVKFTFNATAIDEQPNGDRYYGRHNGWTHVKVETWATANFNFHGKGARSNKTWDEAKEWFELLAGKYEEKETIVVLVDA